MRGSKVPGLMSELLCSVNGEMRGYDGGIHFSEVLSVHV